MPDAMRLSRAVLRRALLLALSCALVTAAQTKKQPPAKPFNLNTATFDQLGQLPGIGPTRAKAILRFRQKSGPFHRVEDLRAVRGISQARFEKIRPYIFVAPHPPPK